MRSRHFFDRFQDVIERGHNGVVKDTSRDRDHDVDGWEDAYSLDGRMEGRQVNNFATLHDDKAL